jgi:hypothetical protein
MEKKLALMPSKDKKMRAILKKTNEITEEMKLRL